MKLCTICDKKIEGTWCKNCHRFVKTYDLPSRIYLNERHDPVNDKDCTYHTDTTYTVVRESTNAGTQRSYTSTTSTSSSGTSRSSSKKKGKKTALIVIIGYILVNCLGAIGPAVVKVFDNISEGFREEDSEKNYYDDYEDYEDETDLSEEELEEQFNRELRNAALLELTPGYHAEEEDYEILYFNPEDIEGIGYSCDNRHLKMSLEEFESWLIVNSTDSFQYTDDISMYSNSYYISSDHSQVNFTCYRDYYSSSNFMIQADYDTATKLLHGVSFGTNDDGIDMDLCYALLKVFEPGTELTREEFAKEVEEAKDAGEYATIYYLEEVYVSFTVNEDGYSLGFRPVF